METDKLNLDLFTSALHEHTERKPAGKTSVYCWDAIVLHVEASYCFLFINKLPYMANYQMVLKETVNEQGKNQGNHQLT